MRNLTLGLMIVAGGTLSALPFRRTEPVDTRPLDAAPIDPVSSTNSSYPSPVGMLVDQSEPQAEWLERIALESRDSTTQLPVPRELSAALTYEQLSVPISRPEIVEQRFTATEVVRRAAKKESDRASGSPKTTQRPSVGKQSFVALSPPQEKSVLVSASSEKTSLASTPLSETQIEPLPKKSTSSRERFWIRQP